MESSTKHLGFLDQIRGVAIIAVFLFHVLRVVTGLSTLPWGTWHSDFEVSKSFLFLLPFSLGWAGVSIFFVVSGFCIHLSFKQHPEFGAFFLRRFFRIYPPYFLPCYFSPWLFHGREPGTPLCTNYSKLEPTWRWFIIFMTRRSPASIPTSGVLPWKCSFICYTRCC